MQARRTRALTPHTCPVTRLTSLGSWSGPIEHTRVLLLLKIHITPKAPVLMLYGFCFFSTPGTLSGLLEARAGTPHLRTDPARLPRDAQQRPQHPYSTGDSNMLDNVNINV